MKSIENTNEISITNQLYPLEGVLSIHSLFIPNTQSLNAENEFVFTVYINDSLLFTSSPMKIADIKFTGLQSFKFQLEDDEMNPKLKLELRQKKMFGDSMVGDYEIPLKNLIAASAKSWNKLDTELNSQENIDVEIVYALMIFNKSLTEENFTSKLKGPQYELKEPRPILDTNFHTISHTPHNKEEEEEVKEEKEKDNEEEEKKSNGEDSFEMKVAKKPSQETPQKDTISTKKPTDNYDRMPECTLPCSYSRQCHIGKDQN